MSFWSLKVYGSIDFHMDQINRNIFRVLQNNMRVGKCDKTFMLG